MPKVRTFHPRWNPKLLLGAVLFAAFGLALLVRAATADSPTPQAAVLVAGCLGFAVTSLWLARGMSWPWSGPAVMLSDAGLTLWPRQRNARVLPWPEIANIRMDFTNGRVLFDVTDPSRFPARLGPFRSPPHCPLHLRNADGEDFLVAIEDYWRQPR